MFYISLYGHLHYRPIVYSVCLDRRRDVCACIHPSRTPRRWVLKGASKTIRSAIYIYAVDDLYRPHAALTDHRDSRLLSHIGYGTIL